MLRFTSMAARPQRYSLMLAWVVVCAISLQGKVSHSETGETPPSPTTEEVQKPLVIQPVTIRGSKGSAMFNVELKQRAKVTLRLAGKLSSLATKKLSSLSIVVDGEPVHSVWFHELIPAKKQRTFMLEVGLPALPKGFHQLKVLTSLQSEHDPCFLKHQDGAWVKLLSQGSGLLMRTSQITSTTFSDFPAMWERQTPQNDAPKHVHMVMRLPQNPTELASYFAADHVVRALGFSPWMPRGDKAAPVDPHGSLWVSHLETASLSSGSAHEEARAFLSSYPEARAVLGARGRDVVVVGKDAEGMRLGIRALGEAQFRAKCQDEWCLVHQLGPKTPKSAALAPSKGSRVQRLSELGFEQGWTAQGLGQHTLQMLWYKPQHWDLAPFPLLQLRLHTMMTDRWVDVNKSHIQVTLNGTPLGQYSLDSNGGKERYVLNVRVPRQFWEVSQWVIRVRVSMKPPEANGEGGMVCGWESDGDAWVRLEPDSGLWVPRREHANQGLAAFTASPWFLEDPGPAFWDASSLMAMGSLLHHWVADKKDVHVRSKDSTCTTNCLQVHSFDTKLPTPFALSGRPGRAMLRDTSGAFDTPMTPTSRALLLDVSPCDSEEEGGARCLGVWLPKVNGTNSVVAPLDLTQVQSSQALYDGRSWHLGRAEKGGEGASVLSMPQGVESTPVLKSTKEQTHTMVNLIWLMLTLGGVVFGAWYMRRRAKSKTQSSFDKDGYESLEVHK